jgi:hypothetical protein
MMNTEEHLMSRPRIRSLIESTDGAFPDQLVEGYANKPHPLRADLIIARGEHMSGNRKRLWTERRARGFHYLGVVPHPKLTPATRHDGLHSPAGYSGNRMSLSSCGYQMNFSWSRYEAEPRYLAPLGRSSARAILREGRTSAKGHVWAATGPGGRKTSLTRCQRE